MSLIGDSLCLNGGEADFVMKLWNHPVRPLAWDVANLEMRHAAQGISLVLETDEETALAGGRPWDGGRRIDLGKSTNSGRRKISNPNTNP